MRALARSCGLFAILACASSGVVAAGRTDGFRKLSDAQITRAFSGHAFSDGVHFSFRYRADGNIEGAGMGKKISQWWRVGNAKLCVADSSFGESCYDVWTRGAAVRLTFGDDLPWLEGALK